MGRGDKKTRKGKIFAGSFGKSRPHKVKAKATPKKEVTETKEEVVTIIEETPTENNETAIEEVIEIREESTEEIKE